MVSSAFIDTRHSVGITGLNARQSRQGPEQEMLNAFLDKFTVRVPSGCRATLFHEPRLESGFPDLVVVVWKVATTERWHHCRLNLQLIDLRLLHMLTSGSQSIKDLKCLYGHRLDDSLERLHQADVIRQRGAIIRARAVSRLYAVQHIFA
ncbi:MAG: hypothetical protein NT023_10640, partial [Armatimonadetes bacterium]|nr:hypothetical protein [Armatimonadota bacterium]